MEDLRNLHATCKAMCMVCSAATVGQRWALKHVLERRFNFGPDFRAALITTLATQRPCSAAGCASQNCGTSAA
jgi:hypothetical protein